MYLQILPFFFKAFTLLHCMVMIITQKQGLRWDGEMRQGYKSCGCISQHVMAD